VQREVRLHRRQPGVGVGALEICVVAQRLLFGEVALQPRERALSIERVNSLTGVSVDERPAAKDAACIEAVDRPITVHRDPQPPRRILELRGGLGRRDANRGEVEWREPHQAFAGRQVWDAVVHQHDA